MRLTRQKIKLYLAMICISFMAFFTGVPVVPKEKVEQILEASNQNIAAEVIQTVDEQS
jgi:hypothetical protein